MKEENKKMPVLLFPILPKPEDSLREVVPAFYFIYILIHYKFLLANTPSLDGCFSGFLPDSISKIP